MASSYYEKKEYKIIYIAWKWENVVLIPSKSWRAQKDALEKLFV